MDNPKIKISRDISYEQLGLHNNGLELGFGHNYTKNDVLNNSHEKTCTVFGCEVDRFAAVKLRDKLNEFLNNCIDSKYDYREDERKK